MRSCKTPFNANNEQFYLRLHFSLNLQRAWQSSRLGNPEEWNIWLKMLSIALLRESPSAAIRACSRLTSVAPQISRLLFNASFMSCWKELRDAEQDDLINTLETVLRLPASATQSREISQVFLNLEEFMAHADKVSSMPSLYISFVIYIFPNSRLIETDYVLVLIISIPL